MDEAAADVTDLRTDIPHPARMYDFYLGGKDNYPADREAARAAVEAFPQLPALARANRAFLGRAVRFAASLGVTQFLDIGTGIPSPGNTNEVAAAAAPDARVVYVDNDPIVLAHARALLAGMDPTRRTSVLLGDVRDPADILQRAGNVLDFDRPVALMLVAILHFIADSDDPHALARDLLAPLAPGSVLILSHGTGDGVDPTALAGSTGAYRRSTATATVRPHAEVLRFFTGTDLAAPGLVRAPLWRPEEPLSPDAEHIAIYAAVGVKN